MVTITPGRGQPPELPGRGGSERWRTIRYALDRWDRTLRLCLISMAGSAPVVIGWLLWFLLTRR